MGALQVEHIYLGDRKLSVRTSVLEEKATACTMLCCYADELKEGFYPYVEQVHITDVTALHRVPCPQLGCQIAFAEYWSLPTDALTALMKVLRRIGMVHSCREGDFPYSTDSKASCHRYPALYHPR